ncbi:macrocin O-methyltransferase [Seonamhaeicola algicola]|uniref:Macrocin O-methyltransferase n=1 Tax=Seonamhaeicola algicola TaxID=1719036 RepID=A0A5C7B067_9FLAO|nr:TylF/MycF/NovP-related O-methyltransferase [Seonamhaeicola algicola]TXE12045.1 macrocin O-methyltransferase [Seonamhaeicola algicola]
MIKRIKKKIYNKFFKEFHVNNKQSVDINYSDISNEEREILNMVTPYTLTSKERIVSLIRAVKYIEKNKIEGSIVECGVWKGGSIMAVLKALLNLKNCDRHVYLYDTYEGMSEPTEVDKSVRGESATTAYQKKDETWNRIACFSALDEVKANIQSVKYPQDKIHFIKGKVENTIPMVAVPDKIAILRLDTDWYESTLHELNYLYPKLVSGGVIIIDDYGHWEGCRKAVEEYIDNNNIKLFLNRIDYTCRMGVKN